MAPWMGKAPVHLPGGQHSVVLEVRESGGALTAMWQIASRHSRTAVQRLIDETSHRPYLVPAVTPTAARTHRSQRPEPSQPGWLLR